MSTSKIPAAWDKWCRTGKHGKGARKKKALLKCLVNGHVRGYFSDIPLRPELDPTDSMYPSVEHLVEPTNHGEAVVEARIFNDMKSHRAPPIDTAIRVHVSSDAPSSNLAD